MGLNIRAHDVCNSYIHSNQFDILCISETWFTNRTTYLSNSFFFAESSYPSQPHLNRRQDGGLIILMHPSQRSHFTLTYKSRYSLVIQHTASTEKLAFIYFPPSLSSNEVTKELKIIGKSNALIGDFNIRLGDQSGDKHTSTQARRASISEYITTHNLTYIRNTNNTITSRTDHIFSDMKNIDWSYDRNLEFRTDHGLMRINLELESNQLHPSSELGSKRYNFKPFQNEIFGNDFTSTFVELYAKALRIECETALATCCYSMILPSTEETQYIIDATYTSFNNSITHHLNYSLTTYDAHEVKSKPDPLLSCSSSPPTSVLQAVRKFKRSQRHYASKTPIISSDPLKSALQECKQHYANIYESEEEPPMIERQNDVMFSLLFTNEKIKKAIKTYSLNKAMGPDGIHTIVFKTLVESDIFLQSISALFQLFASTGLIPSAWTQCNLHLLVKKQEQPRTSLNTRPIALSAILRRIFERLLMRAWEYQTTQATIDTSWMELDPGQAGFRRGYSTLSHLILSDELSRHENPYSIFLDLKGAFDSVSWSKLNSLLISRNCPPTHRNLILSLICRPAELLLSVNQSERVSIMTKKGVFQGGGISAFIFAIYIDPLAKVLNQNSQPHRPLALLYADDVQLKPKSENEGQAALDLCTHFALKYSMTWSIPKCAVVGKCDSDLILAGSVLPKATEYKYLGAVHRENGVDWRATYTEATAKQSRLLTALSDRNWHPRLRLIIYRTFIRPINEYTAVLTWIWAQRDPSQRQDLLKLMQTSHQTAVKWIFNRRRHLKIMDYISGFGPWHFRMECLKAGLVFCLKKMNSSNPLRAARAFYMVSTSRNFILTECFKSDYATEFWKVDEKEKITWFTWKRQKLKLLQMNAARTSATIAYYSPITNPDLSSPIFLLPWSIFDLALNWRLNNTLLHRTCTCSRTFNRSHLPCLLQTDPLFISSLAERHFITASRRISAASNTHHQLTVFDHLLNCRKYVEFAKLLKIISLALDEAISS